MKVNAQMSPSWWLACAPLAGTTLAHGQALQTRFTHLHAQELTKHGIGGPHLTSDAFNQGMINLPTAMQTNTGSLFQGNHQRQRDNQTFTTQKHGTALAQVLHSWTGVGHDIDLPTSHCLIAKANRHQACGIQGLTGSLARAATNEPLPAPCL